MIERNYIKIMGMLGVVCMVATLILTACASGTKLTQNGQPASPEAKAAFYGNQFLELVERAQNEVIALVGTNGVTRADVAPAIEGFVQIGKGGQDFAHALRAIDTSDVTATEKQDAAVRARNAVTAFEGVINSLTVRIEKPDLRAKINTIISTLKLGTALFDVYQQLAPFLPKQPATGMTFTMWEDAHAAA